MNAGAYRERVVIQKNSITEDEIGNKKPIWTDYFKGHAYMNNLSGAEYWEAAQTQSQNTVVFIFRYHRKLSLINTKEYQLIHNGKSYNISSIDNVQYKNEIIKIRAIMKE